MHTKLPQEIALPATSKSHQIPDHLQNRLLVTPVEAGACVGWAKQTVYNRLNGDDFPIPLVMFNGRKMVRVFDLVQYIVGLEPDAPTPSRRPGRPTKAESIRSYKEKKGVAA
jgi:hypothetical protein